MDETFHLTAVDVRRYDFGRALRGYEPERVEQFREQVAEEIERLARLAQDFEQKAKGFHEQLRAFRERDKALNEALVSAQQLRAEMRETAERESAVLLREAQSEAERLIDAARNEVHLLEARLAELDRTRRTYLTQMRMAAERHLDEIESQESAAIGQPVSRPSRRMSQNAVPVTENATEG